MVIIQTQRLSLVPLEPAHAEPLFDGLSDERLYEFISDRPPESVGRLRARYEKLAGRTSPDGGEAWLNWSVRAAWEARYIGYVQATVRGGGEAEVAYVLFRDAWGNGFVREAIGAMVDHLCERYGATSFRAVVDRRNTRSVRLLLALGFQHTGFKAGADWIRGALADESEYALAVRGVTERSSTDSALNAREATGAAPAWRPGASLPAATASYPSTRSLGLFVSELACPFDAPTARRLLAHGVVVLTRAADG